MSIQSRPLPSVLCPTVAAAVTVLVLVALVVISDDETSSGTAPPLHAQSVPSAWNSVSCRLPAAETPIFQGSRFAFLTPVSPPDSSRQPMPAPHELKSDWTWPAQTLNISRFVNWGAPQVLPAARWSHLKSDMPSGHVESLQPGSFSAIATALKQLHRAPRVSVLSDTLTLNLHSAAGLEAQSVLSNLEVATARRMLLRHCRTLHTPKVVQLSTAEVLSALALPVDLPVPLMCTRARAAAAAQLSRLWDPSRLPADWPAQLFEAIGGITIPQGQVPHCIPSLLLQLDSIDVPVMASALSASDTPSVLQSLLGDNQYRPHALLRRMLAQHQAMSAASAPMASTEASVWRHPVSGLRMLVPQAGMREQHSLVVAPVLDNTTALLQHSAWRALLGDWRALLSGSAPAPALAPGDEDTQFGAFVCGRSGRRNFSALESACVIDALGLLDGLSHGAGALKAPVLLAVHSLWGIPRGLTTFAQLFRGSDGTMWSHALTLHDAPRVPWRGMHADTARHHQSAASMRSVLAGMAAAKLNVLHWHITDAQSFPLAMRFSDSASGQQLSGPSLAAALVAANGSAGQVTARVLEAGANRSSGEFTAPFKNTAVYTQLQIADLVWEAAVLGVRVLPEVDSPAHAASWAWALQSALGQQSSSDAWAHSLGKGSTGADARGGGAVGVGSTGHATPWEITPGLAPPATAAAWNRSASMGSIVTACHGQAGPPAAVPPGDPSINVVNRYALDPSNPAAYVLLAAVLQGVAAEFPDAYFHWGGDEVYGDCWGRQSHIVSWADAHAEQLGLAAGEATLNQGRMVQALVARHAWFVTRLLLRTGRLPVVWQGSFDMLQSLHGDLKEASSPGNAPWPVQATDRYSAGTEAPPLSIHNSVSDEGVVSPLAAGMPPFNLVQPWKCWGGEDKFSMLRAARDESTGGSTRNSCWYLDWPSAWPDLASHKLWSGFGGGLAGTVQASDLAAGAASRVRVAGATVDSWEDQHARSGIWGGEVSLWSEGVVPSNQHCRLWPRAAGIAQRLWTWAAYSQGQRSSPATADALSTDFGQLLHFNHHLQQALGIPSADLTSSSTEKSGDLHQGSGQCATVHRFAQPSDELLSEYERRPGTAVDPHVVRMNTVVWNAGNGGEGDWPPPDHGKTSDTSGLLGRQTQLGGRSGAILDSIRAMDVDVAGIVEANGWSDPIARDGARRLHVLGAAERHNAYEAYLSGSNSSSERSLRGHQRRLGVVSGDGLQTRAARAGLAHSVMLNTPSGYDLAMMSKWPISVLYWNVQDFERGVLVTAVRGHAFVLVHLHAHDSDERTIETVRVNALVQELTESGWPVAVMGDFNTLSPADAALHLQHQLLKWLSQSAVPQRVRNKHTTTAAKAVQWAKDYANRMAKHQSVVSTHVCLQVYAETTPSQDLMLDYRPMCELLAAGAMHDDCPPSDRCSFTEPTGYSLIEGFSASEMPPFRLDYVLVNPVLVDTSGEHSCHVLQNAATKWLSDHYPVVCSL